MPATNHRSRHLTRTSVALTLAVLVLAAAVLQYFASQPWPATSELLPADATCNIDGRPVANSETESNPISLKAGQRLTVEGELVAWDHPFSTSGVRSRPELTVPARNISFLVVFRKMKFFSNEGSETYDGTTEKETTPDGSQMSFAHTAEAPTEPGLYRLQVLALERSPQLLAKLSPIDAMKPIGVLAEGLVRVDP